MAGSQQSRITRELDVSGAVLIGFDPTFPGSSYHIDGTLGNDGNDGLGWGGDRALKTYAQAVTLSEALVTKRGRTQVYFAPGSYTADHKTSLNANAPFTSLIAVNPTPIQTYGAVYLTATTAGQPVFEVRARGCYIYGFEFGALADAECVILGGATAGNNASGTVIDTCLMVGQNQGLAGVDWQNGVSANALCTIHNTGFYGFTSGSTAGKCLSCSASGIDQPRFARLLGNWFADSDNLIDMNPRGFKESFLRDNTFYANGANQNPDEKIDNTGGNDTIIYQNYLGGTTP